jgi:hypothetical protein
METRPIVFKEWGDTRTFSIIIHQSERRTYFLKKKVPFAILKKKIKWKGINNGSCR